MNYFSSTSKSVLKTYSSLCSRAGRKINLSMLSTQNVPFTAQPASFFLLSQQGTEGDKTASPE